MKLEIYLDSDGLLADWVSKMISLIQHPEIVCQETLNKHPERTQLIREVYKHHPNLFAELDVIPLGRKLVEELRSLGIAFNILTAVGPDHHCFDTVKRTKTEWFKQHFGIPEEHVICVRHSEDKANHVHANAILIDDYEKNVEQWNNSGGIGLLFKDDETTVDMVVTEIIQRHRSFNAL